MNEDKELKVKLSAVKALAEKCDTFKDIAKDLWPEEFGGDWHKSRELSWQVGHLSGGSDFALYKVWQMNEVTSTTSLIKAVIKPSSYRIFNFKITDGILYTREKQ